MKAFPQHLGKNEGEQLTPQPLLCDSPMMCAFWKWSWHPSSMRILSVWMMGLLSWQSFSLLAATSRAGGRKQSPSQRHRSAKAKFWNALPGRLTSWDWFSRMLSLESRMRSQDETYLLARQESMKIQTAWSPPFLPYQLHLIATRAYTVLVVNY